MRGSSFKQTEIQSHRVLCSLQIWGLCNSNVCIVWVSQLPLQSSQFIRMQLTAPAMLLRLSQALHGQRLSLVIIQRIILLFYAMK